MDYEEKYVSLQEEAASKTKKLKELWKQLQAANNEVQHVCTYMLYVHTYIRIYVCTYCSVFTVRVWSPHGSHSYTMLL